MESSPFPFTGLLYIYFTEFTSGATETNYKDIRLEYISYINDSVKLQAKSTLKVWFSNYDPAELENIDSKL